MMPMPEWLRRLWRKAPGPLRGAPSVRRQKTYSAQSGYVYQYYYEGCRPAGEGTEYVFDVSADRKTSFTVVVLLQRAAVEAWTRERGRELTATECYAAAKLALFQAFDERPKPADMRATVRIRATDLRDLLQSLDL